MLLFAAVAGRSLHRLSFIAENRHKTFSFSFLKRQLHGNAINISRWVVDCGWLKTGAARVGSWVLL